MIELRAVAVEDTGRGLNSANYTLTEREGLTLFRLDWRQADAEHEDDRAWSNEWGACVIDIEFWAATQETALDELAHNVRTFLRADLNEFSTDEDLSSPRVQVWVNSIRPELLCLDWYAGVSSVVEMNAHVGYVVRKFAELVDHLKGHQILDRVADFDLP